MKPFYQEWAESLGITQTENGTWIQAISTHLGATKENGTYITGLTKKLNLYTGPKENMERKVRKWRKENGQIPTTPTEPVTPPAPTGPTLKGLLFETPVGTSNLNNIPIYGLYNYSLTHTLIMASELPTDMDLIDAIQFQLSGYSGGYTMANQVIKISHTSNGAFSYGTVANNSNGYIDFRDTTEVYNGSITYSTGWNNVSFTNNFQWNGTDNIIITFENRSGQWKSGYGWGEGHSGTFVRTAFIYVDAAYPGDHTVSMNMLRTSTRLNIKLGY